MVEILTVESILGEYVSRTKANGCGIIIIPLKVALVELCRGPEIFLISYGYIYISFLEASSCEISSIRNSECL